MKDQLDCGWKLLQAERMRSSRGTQSGSKDKINWLSPCSSY